MLNDKNNNPKCQFKMISLTVKHPQSFYSAVKAGLLINNTLIGSCSEVTEKGLTKN